MNGYRKMRVIRGITPPAHEWEPGALREHAARKGVPVLDSDDNAILMARLEAARALPIVFPGKECLVTEAFAEKCERAGIMVDARTPMEKEAAAQERGKAAIAKARETLTLKTKKENDDDGKGTA